VYREVIQEADTVLNSKFWGMILEEIAKEQHKIIRRMVSHKVDSTEDSYRITYMQGEIDGLSRMLKVPEAVLAILRDKNQGSPSRS